MNVVTHRPCFISANRSTAAGDAPIVLSSGVETPIPFARATRFGSDFFWSSAEPHRVYYRGKRPLVTHFETLGAFNPSAGGGGQSLYWVTLHKNGSFNSRIQRTMPWGYQEVDFDRIALLQPNDYFTLFMRQTSGVQMQCTVGGLNILTTGFGLDVAQVLA